MYGVGIFFGCIALLFAVWLGLGSHSAFLSPSLPYVATTTSRSDADRILNDALSSGEASPLRGLVTFREGSSRTHAANAREEYVVIRTAREVPVGTSLAGWSIQNNAGERYALPDAVETLRTGAVNTPAPVTVGPEQELIVVTGRSPIGYSFRENLCTGYLEEHQDFVPALSLTCPYPADELARSNASDETCRTYVGRMNRCMTDTDAPRSLSCAPFIETALTYNGCVAAHQSDPTFQASTWRLFLGRSRGVFDNERDTLRLLDVEGKIVDVLSY